MAISSTSFKDGNQFWKQRSKHGRDKLFAHPELMWEAACQYFTWCDDNPLMDTEAKVVSRGNGEGSEVELIQVPKMRAYTMHGLCQFLNCNTAYFRQFKTTCTPDFSTVVSNIEETIYNQKFTGAASGFLKENIIARDLGLADKKDVEATVKTQIQKFKIGDQEISFE